MNNWVETIEPYLSTIARIAYRLSAEGWAEKNAGNFSIKIGDLLLTKIAGSLMKRIACKPLPYLCLVQPEKNGFHYRVFPSRAKPTRELATHLLGQKTLSKFRPKDIALLHTHPVDIVELTHLYPKPQTLLQVISLLDDPIKDTVAVLPFLKPGSLTLARATARALKKSQLIIWVNHGVIASGKTLFTSFRLIQRLNRLTRKLLLRK